MFVIDPTTLSDLEVFRDSAGGGGIFALVDETETAQGRKALRRRFETPASEGVEIRRVQAAVRFFVEHPDALKVHPDSADAAERYLRSNIQVSEGGPPATLEALWVSSRYPQLFRELRDGVSASRHVLTGALQTARGILEASAPPLLEELSREVVDLHGVLSAQQGKSRSAVIRSDQVLRGSAREAMHRLLELAGELDALRAMARATARWSFVMPEVVDSSHFLLEGEGLWHPFVTDPVGNPVELSGGEPMVFLTGPNMAGKTTYLRCAALTVLLAQVGMGVPARRLRMTPVEVLLTSLNPADNLRAGLSFFYAEVLRVRAAAEALAAGKRAFVLFDEVFKGTNVKDALEASATVILGFARARGSGFIFSSHLVELVDALRANPSVRFRHFDGSLVEGRARYSYRIRDGVSDQRFGLQLLTEAEIPDLLARIGA